MPFARNANRPGSEIGGEELASLGWRAPRIIEALGVVELFAGFNRSARAMRIAVDF